MSNSRPGNKILGLDYSLMGVTNLFWNKNNIEFYCTLVSIMTTVLEIENPVQGGKNTAESSCSKPCLERTLVWTDTCQGQIMLKTLLLAPCNSYIIHCILWKDTVFYRKFLLKNLVSAKNRTPCRLHVFMFLWIQCCVTKRIFGFGKCKVHHLRRIQSARSTLNNTHGEPSPMFC